MRRKIVIASCGALAALSIGVSETRAASPQHTMRASHEGASLSTPIAAFSLFPASPSTIAPPRSLLSGVPSVSETSRVLLAPGAHCPSDMIEVEGEHCPYVQQNCLRWIDSTTHMRCAEFAPSAKCRMPTTHKHFCVDRFEWPNKVGEKPVFMKSWREAKDMCSSVGKRLCTDSEWTLACEGPEHLPYPYGLKRNKDACNIDKPYGFPDPVKVYDPRTQAAELARLDEREPSGNRAACVSPYGVHDMAGNVDEWVVNETGNPFNSGLKGGYWGPVKTRCRPMTIAHEETFRYYQIGFRCCGG